MGFDEGRILLDTVNGVYSPGQAVHGSIIFDQGKAKIIHGICVSFKGFCKVHWTTRRRRRVNKRTVTDTIHHNSYEEYFNSETYVCGSSSGDHHLQAGHYQYNFDFILPTFIPSSLEGEYGHIRYRVKVTMLTTGFLSSNKEKKAAIRVVAPVDLNLNPYCRQPIEMEISKSYCCWCVTAGTSEIQVSLPSGGYCPGQTIPIEVNISNLSRVDINDIKFSVKREMKFTATTNPGVKIVKETLAETRGGPAAAGTVPTRSLRLVLPAVDTYNFDGCRFIDISHYFKITVEVSGCHKNTDASQYIILGNIPLANQYPPSYNPAVVQPQPNVNYPPNMPYPIMGEQPQPDINYPPNMPYPSTTFSDPPPPYPGISTNDSKKPESGNISFIGEGGPSATRPSDANLIAQPSNPFASASAPQF